MDEPVVEPTVVDTDEPKKENPVEDDHIVLDEPEPQVDDQVAESLEAPNTCEP